MKFPCLHILILLGLCLSKSAVAEKIPRVAAIVTEYRHNSHADVIVSRLLQTETLDGKGRRPKLKLVSLFTDQIPRHDTSRKLAKQHGFRLSKTVADALTLGTGKLAVDGVLLIAEHGKYPKSKTGQTVFPKRRLFGEIVAVFKKSRRVVPVFSDKHLADNWKDAQWLHATARTMKIPLMAGSSLPVLWRYPAIDVKRGAKLKEVVAVSYHTLDAYGFHALEMVQSLVERRAGGETGVKSVQCLTGQAVWKAGKRGVYDRKLLQAALSRLKERPLPTGRKIEDLAKKPVLCIVDYRDGLKVRVLSLNYAVAEWAVAWKSTAGKSPKSTLFWTQEARPFMHFTYLLRGIEKMIHTGKPVWPAERTLVTSGVLDALHISLHTGGKKLETPWLNVRYQSTWNWQQPPPPPKGRPINAQ